MTASYGALEKTFPIETAYDEKTKIAFGETTGHRPTQQDRVGFGKLCDAELLASLNDENIITALINTLAQLQQNYGEKYNGTTLVLIFVLYNPNRIITASMGDSRALLIHSDGTFKRLNQEIDNPNDFNFSAKERARVSEFLKKDEKNVWRVNRLTVTRSIGSNVDGIDHTAHIYIDEFRADDVLLLGCDGLVEVKNSKINSSEEDVVKTLRDNFHLSPQKLAALLVQNALKKSTDNITVLFMPLARERIEASSSEMVSHAASSNEESIENVDPSFLLLCDGHGIDPLQGHRVAKNVCDHFPSTFVEQINLLFGLHRCDSGDTEIETDSENEQSSPVKKMDSIPTTLEEGGDASLSVPGFSFTRR